MTFEIIILGLVSTVRPTSLAAVYTLVSDPEPRRLMVSYVIAGLAFTVAFGMLVVWAFGGLSISSGSGHAKGIADLAGGILAIVFAVSVARGRIGGHRTSDAPRTNGRFEKLREHRLTPRVAALAGPATHVPGLFYLIALNLIVAADPPIGEGLANILIYNVIWFAIPLGALAVCIVNPEAARDAVGAIDRWTKLHARQIVATVVFAVGCGLVVRGLIALL